jgi:hypothetical protein
VVSPLAITCPPKVYQDALGLITFEGDIDGGLRQERHMDAYCMLIMTSVIALFLKCKCNTWPAFASLQAATIFARLFSWQLASGDTTLREYLMAYCSPKNVGEETDVARLHVFAL